jgi:hypothetical protein
MTRLFAVFFALLALTGCGFELPDGTIRPVDEYCLPTTCASDQVCFEGACYDQCEHDANCETGCCHAAKGTTVLYCAPVERCE